MTSKKIMDQHKDELFLPIMNRTYAWIKATKIYVMIVIVPLMVSISNPTSFNLSFSAVFFITPILPLILYLRKNNVETATLKLNCIEVKLNNKVLKINFSEIEKITQMIALWVSSQPGFSNVYEIRLKSKREFGGLLLIEFKSKTNPTEEHELITELKNRIKTGGNISYI